MHEIVRRNLRKRLNADPWCLETSTMYRPGENSVAEQTHTYAKQIAEGKVKERSLLFSHREAPPDTDMSDRESLTKGLRVAYGPAAAWMDLDGIIAEIYDPQSDPSDSRRYWLNQVVASSDSWMAPDAWGRCTDASKVIADGDLIALGFDGSIRDDSTALVACRIEDGHLAVLGCWERPSGPEGTNWMVDREEVDNTVAGAFERFDVAAYFCDPAHWMDYVDKWTRDYAETLRVKASPAQPLEWWTNRSRQMVMALERFHAAVLDHDLSHDGGTLLTRHVLNARRRTHRAGILISKVTPQSPAKIDAAMAAVLAFEARADARAAGVEPARAQRRSRRLVRF
jgi:phage terminase large subunit-like protein